VNKFLTILVVVSLAACNSRPSSNSCGSAAMIPNDETPSASVKRGARPSVNASPNINVTVDESMINVGKAVQSAETHSIVLPIWSDDLVRYEGNPVIVGSDVSPRHSFVADPYLLVVNDRLYMFFEAFLAESSSSRFSAGVGEIWMAESTDGYTWSRFKKVSVVPKHLSHPEALIYNGKVHIFYNHNKDGSISYRWSPLDTFPTWSEESVVFTASKLCIVYVLCYVCIFCNLCVWCNVCVCVMCVRIV